MFLLKGADPEFFLARKEGSVSKYAFPPKWLLDEPFEVKGVGRIVADGFAIEAHPVPDVDFEVVIERTRKLLKIFEMETGLEPLFAENMALPADKSKLAEMEGFYEEALRIGCDPFYYIPEIGGIRLTEPTLVHLQHIFGRYSDKESEEQVLVATAGGHVHVELPEALLGLDACAFLIREAVSLRYITRRYDQHSWSVPCRRYDDTKRTMDTAFLTREDRDKYRVLSDYTSFRPKEYGIELRSASSLWARPKALARDTMLSTIADFEQVVIKLALCGVIS